METINVQISIPKDMEPFFITHKADIELKRNALLLYPHIQSEEISHGKAAELLGISKIDLIVLYSKIGLPYLDGTAEELDEDINAINKVRSRVG